MAKVKKSFLNPFSFRDFANNASQMFDYTMNNLMDNYYDTSTDQSTDGVFKAVVLSGMKTENNTGTGTGKNDAVVQGRFIFLTVRPLISIGSILPDPRSFDSAEHINNIITLHGNTFLARSDYEFTNHTPLQFGQVINCYYENGSITNSNFSGLRFQEPQGIMIDDDYAALAGITGVQTTRAAFLNGNKFLLGGSGGELAPGEFDPAHPPRKREYKGTTAPFTGQVISNGMLPDEMLGRPSKLNQAASPLMLKELVPSWEALRADFLAQFPNCYLSGWGYRTYARQHHIKFAPKSKGGKDGLAARPGTSNHGWGQAVDIHFYKGSDKDYTSLSFFGAHYKWLFNNGAGRHGWKAPRWAQANDGYPNPKKAPAPRKGKKGSKTS